MYIVRLIIKIFIVIVCVISVLYWYMSPLLHTLPKPTGSYGIGIQSYYLENNNQKFMAQFWYPIDGPKACSYPYGEKIVNTYIISFIAQQIWYLPSIMFRNALNICSYAQPDVALSVAKQKYPLIIFCPGFGSSYVFYSSLLENLASQGFIVLSINSQPINIVTFPDGSIIEPDAHVFSDDKEIQKGIDACISKVKFVIDWLTKINNEPNTLWYEHFDLTKLIIIGHSFGGSVAVELARQDKRFKAGINIDGWLEMRSTDGITIPFLFLLNDSLFPPGKQEGMQEIEQTCKKSKSCTIKIVPGAGHFSFYDFAFLKWPFNKSQPDLGSGNPYEIYDTINNLITTFIYASLKNENN